MKKYVFEIDIVKHSYDANYCIQLYLNGLAWMVEQNIKPTKVEATRLRLLRSGFKAQVEALEAQLDDLKGDLK